MKITDEQVEKVCDFVYPTWYYDEEAFKRHGRETVRNALEVAFRDPPGFCIETLNCRLALGHKGGCERS
jgi:hypothetical protein